MLGKVLRTIDFPLSHVSFLLTMSVGDHSTFSPVFYGACRVGEQMGANNEALLEI